MIRGFVNLILISLFLLFNSCFLIPNSPVFAHPIDEFGDIKTYDQKQTLLIGPGQIRLVIDLTFYALDKTKVWESIDTNRDRMLSQEEQNNWKIKGQNSSWLVINGERSEFTADRLVFPDYYEFFATAPAKVVIDFISPDRISPGRQISYHYQGKDKSLSEIEFSARGRENLAVSSLQKIPPSEISISVRQGTDKNDSTVSISTNDRLNRFLATYVKPAHLSSPWIILSACLVAFMIGALHAFTPGHGKTIVASYLIGEGGSVKQALSLGLIVTLTHSTSVFILGLGSLLLTQFLVPAKVAQILSKVSGIFIVVFGLWLLYQRIKKYINRNKLNNNKNHQHPISINWKNLLTMGVSGGMVPCIDALAILVVAASLQKILLGLFLLFTFSLGLASALISLGLLAVVARQAAAKKFSFILRYQYHSGIFSAVVVTLLGLAMLIKL